jgi:hypothetical protein
MWVRAGFCALVLAGSICGAAHTFSAPSAITACGAGTYENSDGMCIPDPEQAPSGSGVPAGASAVCRDGDYSFSTHHSGTCSGHGGVSQWLTS